MNLSTLAHDLFLFCACIQIVFSGFGKYPFRPFRFRRAINRFDARLPVAVEGRVDFFFPNRGRGFINNTLLVSLSESNELKKEIERQKVSWMENQDVVRKLYNEIIASEDYKTYMTSAESGIKEDRNLLINIIVNHFDEHDLLNHVFEEQNIHYADDTFLAFNSAIRTFESFDGKFKLMPLLKDVEDDKLFVSTLFKKTIQYKAQYEELIQTHTKNWELDRIANMDMLLMKMAIAEILHLKNVPVKVSLNEYIDISKEYSTPNSKTFVNGVLDKIILQLKTEGKIEKAGRGLQE